VSCMQRRRPQEKLDLIERSWVGETVFCIASGPSLTKEQVEATKGKRLIVVNDNYLIAPWADLLYFADLKWWKWHTEGLQKSWSWAKFQATEVKKALAEFKGQKVSIENGKGNTVEAKDVFIIGNHGYDKLSEKPDGVNTGSNSGYQAINIAVLAGAKKIVLLGYDMRYDKNRTHAHNGHPQRLPESSYKGFAQRFKSMIPQLEKLGVEVLNATPGSAIDAFKKVDLASFLSSEKPALVQEAGV
jgi:hypothetical protein